MAYLGESIDNDGNTDTYFLIDHAVGKNVANWWSDIQVVQYLIRRIYMLNYGESNAGCWNVSEVTKNDMADLPYPPTDFRNLKKTTKWIEYFQADALLYNGFLISNDGVVNAISYKQFGGRKPYTIYLLNVVLQESFKSIHAANYADYILQDPVLGNFARAQLTRK